MDPQEWIVRADSRELRFTGVLLAEAGSDAPGKMRWIELALYKTTGGNYVVERVGRTDYVTNPDTGKPEYDLFFGQVCDTADAVIETLKARDNEGAWFLSNVAKRLLNEASGKDEPIRKAYTVEHVN